MRKRFSGKWRDCTVFAFTALLSLSIPGFALAQLQGRQPVHAVPPASVSSPATTNLSPIVVKGHKLYLPVALQMIKAALHRPLSFTQKNLNKLVCQFTGITGSHFQRLDCRTNCQRWIQNEAAQGFHVSTQLCDSGNTTSEMAVTIAGWTAQRRVNRGALLELLKKLPPADSSYTLRVKDHGKVVVEYVFDHGSLVSVYRKSTGDKHGPD